MHVRNLSTAQGALVRASSGFGCETPETPLPPILVPVSCVYHHRLLLSSSTRPGPRRRQASWLASSRFEKDCAQAAFPPLHIRFGIDTAVRKSCCRMVSRTLVERCGRVSPSSLGCIMETIHTPKRTPSAPSAPTHDNPGRETDAHNDKKTSSAKPVFNPLGRGGYRLPVDRAPSDAAKLGGHRPCRFDARIRSTLCAYEAHFTKPLFRFYEC